MKWMRCQFCQFPGPCMRTDLSELRGLLETNSVSMIRGLDSTLSICFFLC